MATKKPAKSGRRKGSKNLIRKDDTIINQYGVQITESEARRLRSLVNSVNRKAKRLEEEFSNKPLMYGNRPTGEDRQQLKLMGDEMDLMIRRRSASLNQFQSRKQLQAYIRSAERAAKIDYTDVRGKLYKQNLLKAIDRNYGQFPELIKGVKMKIQMMPQKQFQELIGTNRAFQIGFQYSTSEQISRIANMRDFLGLRSDMYDDYM